MPLYSTLLLRVMKTHTEIITVEFKDKGVWVLFVVILDREDDKDAQVFVAPANNEKYTQQ